MMMSAYDEEERETERRRRLGRWEKKRFRSARIKGRSEKCCSMSKHEQKDDEKEARLEQSLKRLDEDLKRSREKETVSGRRDGNNDWI